MIALDADAERSLPTTTIGCDVELAELRDEMAAIKIQIADANFRRQEGERIDRVWVHRARTAMRHKQRRYDALIAHRRDLNGGSRRGSYARLAAIVSIVEGDYEPDEWAAIIEEAEASVAEGTPPCSP